MRRADGVWARQGLASPRPTTALHLDRQPLLRGALQNAYRPGFPDRFDSIEQARELCRSFFGWYNHEHRHHGIGLMTPAAVQYGQADHLYDRRAAVLADAYARNPERFVHMPPAPPELQTAARSTSEASHRA